MALLLRMMMVFDAVLSNNSAVSVSRHGKDPGFGIFFSRWLDTLRYKDRFATIKLYNDELLVQLG